MWSRLRRLADPRVGGVGYRVYCAPAVLTLARAGERIKLFTHHVVREDLQALYGFRTPEELGFFGLLLTVTGVGPKVALAMVGSRPWETCSWRSFRRMRRC